MTERCDGAPPASTGGSGVDLTRSNNPRTGPPGRPARALARRAWIGGSGAGRLAGGSADRGCRSRGPDVRLDAGCGPGVRRGDRAAGRGSRTRLPRRPAPDHQTAGPGLDDHRLDRTDRVVDRPVGPGCGHQRDGGVGRHARRRCRRPHPRGSPAGQRPGEATMSVLATYGDPSAWVRNTLRGLVGTILEIGPGSGTNCSYFRSDIAWIGLEPDLSARPALLAASARFDLEPQVIGGRAEQIPLPTGAVDAVVGTRVLCSVRKPEQVLSEIVRVLRPLGTFVFVEHVAAPRGSGLRLAQRLAAPLSRWFDNGCDPARDTERALRAATWQRVAVDHYAEPGPFGVPGRIPHIAGTAVR